MNRFLVPKDKKPEVQAENPADRYDNAGKNAPQQKQWLPYSIHLNNSFQKFMYILFYFNFLSYLLLSL